MKKILFIYVSALAIVCACSKSNVPAEESGQKEQEGIVVPEGYVLYQLSSDCSKVAIGGEEGKTLSWEGNDEIKLVTDKGKYKSQKIEILDDGSAKFTFAIQEGNTPLFGVYPATIVDDDITTIDDDKLKVKLPEDAETVASFSNSNVMCGKVNDGSIAFNNVAHLIKFEIEDALAGATGIQICNLDGTPVIGEISVGFTDAGVNVTSTGTGENVISKAVNGAGTYYIAVLPADDDSKWSGIGIRTVTESVYSTGFIFAKDITHKSNAITNLGNIDNRFNTEVSVTDAAKLKKVLDTEDNIAKIWYLNKKTLNRGVGTYKLPQTFEIKNTKVEDGITFTIKGAGKDKTTIDGNNKRFLYVNGSSNSNTKATEINIDGVTIKNCYNTQDGGAIKLNSGKASLDIKNSLLTENEVLNGTTKRSGAVLSVSAGNATVSNCEFQNNKAGYGAAIHTEAKGKIVVKESNFSSEVATAKGGAVYVNGGTHTYEGCHFNKCSSETEKGGAIYCTGSSSTMNLKGCEFKECEGYSSDKTGAQTKAGGAIALEGDGDGIADIENCTFDGNIGSTGAVFYLNNASGLIRVNNSVFKNNKCNSRGLIRMDLASAIFLNNCSFHQNKTNGQWGHILHADQPSVACFNNCTIHDNNSISTSQGDHVCLHQGGHLVVTNSTIVNSNGLCLLRNDKDTGKQIFVANSILLNTYKTSGKVFDKGNMKATCKTYNCYLGQASDETFTTGKWDSTNDKKYIAALAGGHFDDVNLVYLWNGPAEADEFTKAKETEVLGYLNAMTTNNGNTKINGAFGPAFATWVESKGGFAKDALGNARTADGTWPGAIEN